MRIGLGALLIASVLASVGGPDRAEAGQLAPVPKGEAVSSHGPYEMGDCETCHERRDPADPGAALKASNDLCFECHDEFRGNAPVKMERSVHPSARAARCTACHNPHNSRKKKLRL